MGFIIDDFLHITMYDNVFYILFYTKKQLDLIIKSNPNLNNIQDFIDLSDNFFKRAFIDKYDHQDLQYPIHYAFLTSLGYEFFSLDNKFIFNNLESEEVKNQLDVFINQRGGKLVLLDLSLYLAKKYQFKVREVPVIWQHHATDRVNPIKDSLLMLKVNFILVKE